MCTPSHTHFELAWAALEAGKHVLCEKPVAYDYRDTRRARGARAAEGTEDEARASRSATAPRCATCSELIDEGFIGTPFIFNGYEQNSQWLDPMNPLRQVDPDADQSVLQVSSLEGYGAPIIDLAHLVRRQPISARSSARCATSSPSAMVRATGRMMRMNIDDGDIFLGEFANGALCSVQTSFVTVGNYPGHRSARLRQQGRAHLPAGRGGRHLRDRCGRRRADQVEFRELEVPARCYPPGGSRRESWRTLFYANLVSSFIGEILSGGDRRTRATSRMARWVQEVINAVEQSFRERRWVAIPLAGEPTA